MSIHLTFYLIETPFEATPNNFLDSHPNLVKNWGGWEVFSSYFFRLL